MRLTGEQVSLRPLTERHLPMCFRWIHDPEVIRYLHFPIPKTMKEERRWFREIKEKSPSEKLFAIHHRQSGTYIGNITLHKIDTKRNKNCSLGILVGEKGYWDRGFGSDAIKTLLRYCFEKLKLHKVSLIVDPKNKRAIRCYEKCGFRKEGYLKDEIFHKRKWCDAVLMAVLKKN